MVSPTAAEVGPDLITSRSAMGSPVVTVVLLSGELPSLFPGPDPGENSRCHVLPLAGLDDSDVHGPDHHGSGIHLAESTAKSPHPRLRSSVGGGKKATPDGKAVLNLDVDRRAGPMVGHGNGVVMVSPTCAVAGPTFRGTDRPWEGRRASEPSCCPDRHHRLDPDRSRRWTSR